MPVSRGINLLANGDPNARWLRRHPWSRFECAVITGLDVIEGVPRLAAYIAEAEATWARSLLIGRYQPLPTVKPLRGCGQRRTGPSKFDTSSQSTLKDE